MPGRNGKETIFACPESDLQNDERISSAEFKILREHGITLEDLIESRRKKSKGLVTPLVSGVLASTIMLGSCSENLVPPAHIASIEPQFKSIPNTFTDRSEISSQQVIESPSPKETAHKKLDKEGMDFAVGKKIAEESLKIAEKNAFDPNTTTQKKFALEGVRKALGAVLGEEDSLPGLLGKLPSSYQSFDTFKVHPRFKVIDGKEFTEEEILELDEGTIPGWLPSDQIGRDTDYDRIEGKTHGTINIVQPKFPDFKERLVTNDRLETLEGVIKEMGHPSYVIIPIKQEEKMNGSISDHPLQQASDPAPSKPDKIPAAEQKIIVSTPISEPTKIPTATPKPTEKPDTTSPTPTTSLSPVRKDIPTAQPKPTEPPTATPTSTQVPKPPENSPTPIKKPAELIKKEQEREAGHSINRVEVINGRYWVYTYTEGYKDGNDVLLDMKNAGYQFAVKASDEIQAKRITSLSEPQLAKIAQVRDTVVDTTIKVENGKKMVLTINGFKDAEGFTKEMGNIGYSQAENAIKQNRPLNDRQLMDMTKEYNKIQLNEGDYNITEPLDKEYDTPAGKRILKDIISELMNANSPFAYEVSDMLNNNIPFDQSRIESLITDYKKTVENGKKETPLTKPVSQPPTQSSKPEQKPIFTPNTSIKKEDKPTPTPAPTNKPVQPAKRVENPQQTSKEWPKTKEGFPEPPNNTRILMHWSPDIGFGYDADLGLVKSIIPTLEEMGVTSIKLVVSGAKGVKTAREFANNNIMPVVRIYKGEPNPDGLNQDELSVIPKYVQAGAPYFEINNEPNLGVEWKGWQSEWSISDKDPEKDRKWKKAAEEAVALSMPAEVKNMIAVQKMGGHPLLSALSPGGNIDDMYYYEARAKWLASNKCDLADESSGSCLEIFKPAHSKQFTAAIAIHNYNLNHPVDYNKDSNGFLKFRFYRKIDAKYGIKTVYVATEGGPLLGDKRDSTFSVVDKNKHRDLAIGMAQYLRNRQTDEEVIVGEALWVALPNTHGDYSWDGHAYWNPDLSEKIPETIQGLKDVHSGKR